MAGVVGLVEAGIYTKLNVTAVKTTAGATGVYNRIAPQTTALPYVIFQWQGGGDENSHPDRSRDVIYTIKALARDAVTADTIDAACDVLLHDGLITVTGYNVIWLRRESDVAYSEVDASGQPVYHTGGMYRIRIEKA